MHRGIRRAGLVAVRVAVALCCVLFAGCLDPAASEDDLEPYAAIASLRCELAGVQIIVEGTFDVRLPADRSVVVDAITRLQPGTKTVAASYFGCNDWKTVRESERQQGCMRLGDQPETQSISLRQTENITAGTMPTVLEVDVLAVAQDAHTDFSEILVQRTIRCSR